jgi:hypothetical protein
MEPLKGAASPIPSFLGSNVPFSNGRLGVLVLLGQPWQAWPRIGDSCGLFFWDSSQKRVIIWT